MQIISWDGERTEILLCKLRRLMSSIGEVTSVECATLLMG